MYFEILFISVIGLATAWMFRSFLLPLAMAGIFSVMLWNWRNRLLAKKWLGHGSASLLITVFFSLVFLLPGVGILIAGTKSLLKSLDFLKQFGDISNIPNLIELLGLEKAVVFAEEQIVRFEIDPVDARAAVIKVLQSLLSAVVEVVQAIVKDIPELLMANIIIVLALYFFLKDGDLILKRIRTMSPFSKKMTTKSFQYISQLSQAVIWAALAAGGAQALIIALASALAHVGAPAVVAVVIFICSFIPLVGSSPASIGLVLYAAFTHQWRSAIILGIAAFIASISDNFIRPLVLKGGAELHPLIGFLAAFGGLQIFGFYGLFVGPILAGFCFYIFHQKWDDLHDA
jgi:predicted PurR-regulated permease PerM